MGVGSAFNPAMGNNSAWFAYDNVLYVIDCGQSVFSYLWQMPEIRTYRDIYVIVTHMHNDHVGSLGTLSNACCDELNKKLHIIHPESNIVQFMSLMGLSRDEYHYHPSTPVELPVFFEPVLVEHVANMNSYGYIIRTPHWTVYFSGDAVAIPEHVLKQLSSGEIECIYQDTSLKEYKPHAPLSYLERVIPRDMRCRVYCVHLERGASEYILSKGFQIPNH